MLYHKLDDIGENWMNHSTRNVGTLYHVANPSLDQKATEGLV